jgi:salicylate hydroxylase
MRAAIEDALRVARGAKSTLASAGNANQWADKEKTRMQFGYNADEEAEKWWRDHGHTLVGSSRM